VISTKNKQSTVTTEIAQLQIAKVPNLISKIKSALVE
jgi:hypothetical protein